VDINDIHTEDTMFTFKWVLDSYKESNSLQWCLAFVEGSSETVEIAGPVVEVVQESKKPGVIFVTVKNPLAKQCTRFELSSSTYSIKHNLLARKAVKSSIVSFGFYPSKWSAKDLFNVPCDIDAADIESSFQCVAERFYKDKISLGVSVCRTFDL
jgi:hypothetical protein